MPRACIVRHGVSPRILPLIKCNNAVGPQRADAHAASLQMDKHTHTHTQKDALEEEEDEAAAHPQHVVRINDISHEHFARATDGNGNSRNKNNTAHKESETVSCPSCPTVQVVQLSSLQGMSVSAFRFLVCCPTFSLPVAQLPCRPRSRYLASS